MEFGTAGSTSPEERTAISEVYESVRSQLDGAPDLLVLYASPDYNATVLNNSLRELAPDPPIHGGTSCQGILTERGLYGGDQQGLGLLGISDPEGDYGVGVAELDDSPRERVQRAVDDALDQVGRAGEVPRLLWITGTPGTEEQLLAGIENIVGPNVPVIGGSAADNDVAGHWHQFANGDVYSDAVTLTAMFPSTEIGFSFHSGYEPTDKSGTATRADGRNLFEIDGRPAAEVYNQWTEGSIDDEVDSGGNVLDKTTLHPLGRRAGRIEENSHYYKLSHPEAIAEDGSISLFTEIAEGDQLVLMTGTVDSLTSRAGRVAEAALDTAFLGEDEIAGALVVYCAGCMLTVEDRLDEVTAALNRSLGGKPFLGTFTFGEQGCFIGGENLHANLMISVVVFCK